jgi:hypothetical protein
MEHWYLPITILPGIGLLILSTSNQLIALSNEISERLKLEICNDQISQRKLKQLKLLNKGLVGWYLGAGIMVASGILSGIQNLYNFSNTFGIIAMLSGVLSVFIPISFLIVYSMRAVKIRQDQY